MRRYDLESYEYDHCMFKRDDGDWVRYEDAATRISKLEAELVQRTADTNAMVGNCEARIAELEAQLAAANAEIERLTGELSPLGLVAPYIVREADRD